MPALLLRTYPSFLTLNETLQRLNVLGVTPEQVAILAHEQHPEVDLLTAGGAEGGLADENARLFAGGDMIQGVGLAATPSLGPLVALGFLAESPDAAQVSANGGSMAEAFEAAGLSGPDAAACAQAIRDMRIALVVAHDGDGRKIAAEIDRPSQAQTPLQVVTPEQQAETAG
jgi:hypothetical protein